MASMVSKAFAKIIGFAGSLFLTLFAGMFGFISVSALIMSVIDKDILTVAASAAAGFAGWMCWNIRKDTLV